MKADYLAFSAILLVVSTGSFAADHGLRQGKVLFPSCRSINSPINFSASNIYLDSANLIGGKLPANSTAKDRLDVYSWTPSLSAEEKALASKDQQDVIVTQEIGKMLLGKHSLDSGKNETLKLESASVDGQFALEVSPNWNLNGTYKSADVKGTVNVSAATIRDIKWRYPKSSKHPELCVKGLGFNLGHYKGKVFGKVFLFLDRGGYVLNANKIDNEKALPIEDSQLVRDSHPVEGLASSAI